MEDLFFMGFFFGMVIFFGTFVLIGIVFYILFAIGLFKIAKREEKGNIAWLAWIPIVGQFLFMYLVENDVHRDVRGKFTLLYGIALFISIMFAYFIPFTPLIPLAFYVYAFYFIVEKYTDNPMFHVAIAIATIGSSIPVQIFMIRNREKIHLPAEVRRAP